MKLKSLVSICLLSLNCGANIIGQNGFTRQIGISSEATIVRDGSYEILGSAIGESSVFLFLGIFPMTPPLNTEYALSEAVQKIEGGQTLINLAIWHETHYYFPIGKVSVVKIEGDVIRFKP